jgi:YVTN family beta-propeller protein
MRRINKFVFCWLLTAFLVACQPIQPVVPAAQRSTTPTVAVSPASEHEVGKIIAEIPVGTFTGPFVAIGDGTVWVPNLEDGTVSRIDTSTNQVVATIQISDKGTMGTYFAISAVALAAGSLWVTNNAAHSIVRLDPATNEVITTIPLDVEPYSMKATDEAVWVSALDSDQVIRIDPQTNTVAATIQVVSPAQFDLSKDTVWVTNLRAGTVSRIDPQTNEVTATIDTPGPGAGGERPEFVAVGEEDVYVVDKRANTIHRIDPATNEVMVTSPSHGELVIVAAVGEEGVWAADDGGGRLLLLDPKTLELIGELAITGASGVTIGEGSIWVTTGDGKVVRVAPQQ